MVDELTIFREITEFYADSMYRRMTFKKKIKEIDAKLRLARSYDEWKSIADEHDALPQIQESLNNVYSAYYDYAYIEELKNELHKARSKA